MHRVLFYSFHPDIENLLGRPFQEELARETGIDGALEELEEVKIGKEWLAKYLIV